MILVILLLITTPLLICSFILLRKDTNDYSKGELVLKAEIQNKYVNQYSELFIKCTMKNNGNNDVRVLKLTMLDFYLYEQNGNRINRTRGGLVASGIPLYYNEDLIVLSKNEEFSKIHQVYLYEFDIPETGYYYFIMKFVGKDFSGHLSQSFWNGTIRSEEITFHIAYQK